MLPLKMINMRMLYFRILFNRITFYKMITFSCNSEIEIPSALQIEEQNFMLKSSTIDIDDYYRQT